MSSDNEALTLRCFIKFTKKIIDGQCDGESILSSNTLTRILSRERLREKLVTIKVKCANFNVDATGCLYFRLHPCLVPRLARSVRLVKNDAQSDRNNA